jgi:hypothetical protein
MTWKCQEDDADLFFCDHAAVISRSKLDLVVPGRESVEALFYTNESLKKLVRALHQKYQQSGTRKF